MSTQTGKKMVEDDEGGGSATKPGETRQLEPPWKRELMMKKTAVGRTFQKGAHASHRTGSAQSTNKDICSSKNASPVISKQLRPVGCRSSLEAKKMPGTGTDAIGRQVNLVDVSQTNSDSTFSECGRSPTFSSGQSDAFSFDSDLSSNSNSELEYGPGIVNKLKSRFIHLTLKESERANNMIPLTTNTGKMRRYASLEGLVDSNAGLKSNASNGHYSENSSISTTANRSQYYQNYNSRRSNMKKARSMDNLGLTNIDRSVYSSMSKSNTYDCDLGKANLNPILINENVVIIESIANGKPHVKIDDADSKNYIRKTSVESPRTTGIEEDEMPKPDTVKTFKQMFEAKKSPDSSSNKSFKKNITKQKLPKFNKNNTTSSAVNGDHLTFTENDKLGFSSSDTSVNNSLNDGDISCEKTVHDASPESESKQTIESEVDSTVCKPKLLNDSDLRLETDRSQDESSFHRPDNDDSKTFNQSHSLSNLPLHKDSNSLSSHSFQEDSVVNVKSAPLQSVEEAESPTIESTVNDTPKPLLSLPPKVVSVHAKFEDKPIANIKPIVNAQRNDDLRNKLNKNKFEQIVNKKPLPIVNGKSNTEEKLVHALSSLPKPRTWHKTPDSGTSVVFDFRDRKDVKAHISNKVAPFGCRPAAPKGHGINIDGIDGEESCDYDEDDDYNGDLSLHTEPCNIEFEGAHMIIGKSAILANRNKRLKIQFDDDAIFTYEYPAETSYLLSDSSSPSPTTDNSVIPYADEEDEQSPPDNSTQNQSDDSLEDVVEDQPSSGSTLKSNPALGSSGVLSSYTPTSLSKQGETYQLGISRHIHEAPSTEKQSTPKDETEENQADEYLKPADEDQTSSWSSATSSDLLF